MKSVHLFKSRVFLLSCERVRFAYVVKPDGLLRKIYPVGFLGAEILKLLWW